MRLLILCSLLLVFGCVKTYAQSRKEKSSESPNSFSPYAPKEEKAQVRQIKKSQKRSFRTSFNKGMDQKIKEYEKRMEANAKRDRKLAREMQKPQYSDPSYFGHKRKPKKRPVGKRKFCKECSIVH